VSCILVFWWRGQSASWGTDVVWFVGMGGGGVLGGRAGGGCARFFLGCRLLGEERWPSLTADCFGEGDVGAFGMVFVFVCGLGY